MGNQGCTCSCRRSEIERQEALGNKCRCHLHCARCSDSKNIDDRLWRQRETKQLGNRAWWNSHRCRESVGSAVGGTITATVGTSTQSLESNSSNSKWSLSFAPLLILLVKVIQLMMIACLF